MSAPINFRRQRGAALFVAVFLITVIVLVAAVVALTSVTQQTGAARAAAAEQAWYAALSRLEAEIPGILSAGDCPGGGDQAVFGFTTTLDCQVAEVTEAEQDYRVYTLATTASQGNLQAGTLVRRTARAQITDAEEP